MKRNIILAIIIISIFSSCGGGGRSVDDNSTQDDNTTDIRLVEINITEINTTIEQNITIVDLNPTENNISITLEDNSTEENITIEEETTPINTGISGNIYNDDGEPQEAIITAENFDEANLTLEIKDDYALTNLKSFLDILKIDDFNDEEVQKLKQFMTLGIALDSNQTQCQEKNSLPFTLEDYQNACITGVNKDNVKRINLMVTNSNIKDTRDIKFILALIDELEIKNIDIQMPNIEPITIIDGNETYIKETTSFTVEDFKGGSFIGINSNNIDDMNNFISHMLNLSTLEELETIIDRIYQHNISVDLICNNQDADLEHNLTEDGYKTACISSNNIIELTSLATDLNLTNTREIRDIFYTTYDMGIDLTPPIAPVQCPQDSAQRIYIKKTGQTNIFEPYDDGYYRAGVSPCYQRKDLGDDKGIVIDKIRGTMWQDSKEIAKKGWNQKSYYDGCLDIPIIGMKDYADENQTIVSYTYTEDDVCELLYDNGDTAYNYCQKLELGGYDDWRLPYILELMDISNYQNPIWIDDNIMSRYAIDDSFKYTSQPAYWARDHYIGFHFQQSWIWGARTGGIEQAFQDIILNIRCIRGNSFLAKKIIREDGYSDQSYIAYDNYSHLEDDITRDNIRRVEWFLVPRTEKKDWKDSVNYCPTSTKDGGGWRLANINELATLYDNHTYLPSIKNEFKKGIVVSSHWSSTTVAYTPGNRIQAFAKYTYAGSLSKNYKNYKEPSFCIRDVILDSNSSSE